jgi:hypothetical protein
MAENRWQIILGAVILMVVLLVGAFSVGVYIGRHGWTSESLQFQPEGPGGQPGNIPDVPQGPSDRPNIIGRVRALSPLGLQLATQDGPRTVEVNQDTRVTDVDGFPLTLVDLRLGDLLAIYGDFTPGDGQRLLAERILRLPPREPPQP